MKDYLEDSLRDAPCKIVEKRVLWTHIPKAVIYRYCADPSFVAQAKELVKEKQFRSSLWYRADLSGNPKRLFYVSAMEWNHFKKYRKYCKR